MSPMDESAGTGMRSRGEEGPGTGTMRIRRADPRDIPQIDVLLREVLDVHHAGRPDLFKPAAAKYTDDQLRTMIADDAMPIFVAVEPGAGSIADGAPGNADRLLGYAFCQFQRHVDDNILTDILTLYIDDLCVDESQRGRHVGTALYRHVLGFAKAAGCHNVTLNVWACNEAAMGFYERCGLKPQKIGMETVLR